MGDYKGMFRLMTARPPRQGQVVLPDNLIMHFLFILFFFFLRVPVTEFGFLLGRQQGQAETICRWEQKERGRETEDAFAKTYEA